MLIHVHYDRVVNLFTKLHPQGLEVDMLLSGLPANYNLLGYFLAYFFFSTVTSPLHFVSQIFKKSYITLQTVKCIIFKTSFILCKKNCNIFGNIESG